MDKCLPACLARWFVVCRLAEYDNEDGHPDLAAFYLNYGSAERYSFLQPAIHLSFMSVCLSVHLCRVCMFVWISLSDALLTNEENSEDFLKQLSQLDEQQQGASTAAAAAAPATSAPSASKKDQPSSSSAAAASASASAAESSSAAAAAAGGGGGGGGADEEEFPIVETDHEDLQVGAVGKAPLGMEGGGPTACGWLFDVCSWRGRSWRWREGPMRSESMRK